MTSHLICEMASDERPDSEGNAMNIAYCATRLQSSHDRARAATDTCARLAHEGFARLYHAKLVQLSGTALEDRVVSLDIRLTAEK